MSPGGVGFDINCGVRLLRTNLDEKDVTPVKVTQTFMNEIVNFFMKSFNVFE